MKKIRITHWQTDCLCHPLSEKLISRMKIHWNKTGSEGRWRSVGGRRYAHPSGGGVVLQTPLISDHFN